MKQTNQQPTTNGNHAPSAQSLDTLETQWRNQLSAAQQQLRDLDDRRAQIAVLIHELRGALAGVEQIKAAQASGAEPEAAIA